MRDGRFLFHRGVLGSSARISTRSGDTTDAGGSSREGQDGLDVTQRMNTLSMHSRTRPHQPRPPLRTASDSPSRIALTDRTLLCSHHANLAVLRNRLRVVLAQRQTSQIDFAEVTGLPYAIVRRLVRPDSNPRLEHALIVSEYLGLPIERMFALADDAPVRGGGVPAIARRHTAACGR